jgi:hypothetical protein
MQVDRKSVSEQNAFGAAAKTAGEQFECLTPPWPLGCPGGIRADHTRTELTGHFPLCGLGDAQPVRCHFGPFHPGSDFFEGDVRRDVRRTMFWLNVDAEG